VNDSLSAFVASAIEFIIGGLMLIASVVFLVSNPAWNLSIRVTQADLSSLVNSRSDLVISIVALGAAYAVGVVGESACRGLLEWDLRRVTSREDRFAVPAEVPILKERRSSAGRRSSLVPPRTADIEQQKVGPNSSMKAVAEDPESQSSISARGVSQQDVRVTLAARARTDIVRVRGFLRGTGLGRWWTVYCTPEEFRAIRRQREAQRALVATKHERLHAEVESQLRRLRVERMAFFAALFGMVGFWVRGERAETILLLGFALGLFWLVHDRFIRYCDVIARGHTLIIEDGLRQVPKGTVAEADETQDRDE
jgi:hypothetical protein